MNNFQPRIGNSRNITNDLNLYKSSLEKFIEITDDHINNKKNLEFEVL